MKLLLNLCTLIAGMLLMQSCTKTESDFTPIQQETITVNASALNVTAGTAVSFSVLSSVNNSNVTAASKIYVNGSLISGSNFTFTAAGTFAVYATKGALVSAVITVTVTLVAPPETITINTSSLNVATGALVSFSVISSINNNNVTAESKIYVTSNLITGNSFTFLAAGTYTVYATKGALTSNTITVTVTANPTNNGYKHHVLVEEYSGTWCGNCPRILYGVDLLHQQTDRAIVVGIHLFNGDPFITTEGNNLAAQQGVGGVPTGYINRTISWTGPQYENVPQVINTIQAFAPAGIAISSTVSGSNLLVNVKAGYKEPLAGGAKLTVYLVEDKLYYTQRNYSANLYGGQANIPNFEYNGVIRKIVSSLGGDAIGASGTTNEKNYSLVIPANISNISNARLVAFITNAAGTVVNVRDVKAGEANMLEVL